MEPGEFQGTIGRYHWESTPWWPPPRRAPEGAPNIVLVVLDDVGFAQLGCFGSDLDTPVFDALAARGLRYRNFHTTALCSPTRSCLLTGRNHHANGMGRITDLATGFPGYDGCIPKANAFLSEILVPHGYAAWAIGKWHLTPDDEQNLAARRDRWPLGRGFERFYGYFGGETHQNAPALVHDSHFVDAPRAVDDGYHLTEDLVDHAIEFVRDLRQVDADKPFFAYLCPGACHSPHHAPPEWIARYHGRFDVGWDVWREQVLARQIEMGLLPAHTVLSERPEWVPAWADLTDDERRVYARYMEAFAGYLSHADHHVGRFLDALADTGDLDNTVVIVVSDNGASSEGGALGSLNDARVWNGAPRTAEEALPIIDEIGGPRWHNNYPWGWTVAGQHAVPPVEARGARRRCRRSADRLLAGGDRGRRAGAHPRAVRARDRHPPDRPRGDRRRRARRRRRRELRAHAWPGPTHPTRTRCSTTRCSARGRCTRTAGRP